MIKWDLPQRCKDGSIATISVIYYINKKKNKNHMIISNGAEKHLTKYNIHS